MADFRINDRRFSARNNSGLVLGQSVAAAKRTASAEASAALSAGRRGVVPTNTVEASQMRRQRMGKVGAYVGGSGFGGGGSLSYATQRPHDPFFYWQQNNLPYDFTNPEHLLLLRQLCRHIYKAHSVMASAIDIYAKWPLLGMEFTCKDKALVEFYTDLFLDTLDYEEFLPSVLHEYWVVGEAFPLGSFNETLGVWEADELLNPDDVFVEKNPFIRDPNLYIRLPESLRKILSSGQPREQYESLMRSYPELQAYANENTKMPVSNILLKHLKFKGDNFSPRGLPIMYRALRPLIQEEMLNSAQDAVADRLYTPLVLARIGASATDLGTDEPWIPTTGQIQDFEAGLDAALAADFRVLTTHFAVQMDSVFGRETMPNLDADFERLTEKELQAFGLSKTMLSGAGSGETYAADALNRDLISQLLGSAQRYIRKFVRDRMLVVAEAQEHYDYEVRGGKRYPIMEEVLEVDEETGEQRIVEQPKLLVPDLKLATMNMRDDDQERQFLEALRESGVPISMQRRLVNIDIDLDEEVEQTAQEQIDQAVEAQRVRKRTYEALKQEGLPIPQDLIDDFQPTAANAGDDQQAADDPTRDPTLGLDGQDTSALAPTPDVQSQPPGAPLGVPAGPGGTVSPDAVGGGSGDGSGTSGDPSAGGAQVINLPRNKMISPDQRQRPPESDEQRAGMPRSSSVIDHLPKPPMLKTADEDGTERVLNDKTGKPLVAKPGGLVQGPRHIGMRRWAGVNADTVLGDEPEPEPGPDEAQEA